MEVQDYNRFIEADEKIDISELCCKWPFRLSVVGPSGSGKTNMVVDMILNHIYFDDIYIMAKDLEEPLYEFLVEKLRSINEMIKENTDLREKKVNFSNQLDLDIDILDKEIQTLIIIDDFITTKGQRVAEELFIRGRKKNASVIYISQSYFQIPKMVRLNSSYFALFDVANKRQIRCIADTHSTRLEFSEFMSMYRNIHKEPYKFMLIDNVTKIPQLHIRCCWDGVCFQDC